MQMADRMAADGYKDVGYEYIVVDDCWLAQTRDAQGKLRPDPRRFPHGMRALADYVSVHCKHHQIKTEHCSVGYGQCVTSKKYLYTYLWAN